MNKLNKRLFLFPLLLLGLSLPGSNANSAPTHQAASIQSFGTGSLKDDVTPQQEHNKLLHKLRFHRGIFGSSVNISQLFSDALPHVKAKDNSCLLPHYFWYLLTAKKELPDYLTLSSPSPLRAPPII